MHKAISLYLKHPAIIGAVAVVLVVGIGSFIYYRSATALPSYAYVAAKTGNIVEEVPVSGTVKANQAVDLAFERSGRIVSLPVPVGGKVAAGGVLAKLDDADLAAALAQAQANAGVQQAKLDDLKNGPTPQSIQVAQAQLDSASQNLANSYQGAYDALGDAYAKSDDAVRNQLGPMFSTDNPSVPQLLFQTVDSQTGIDLQNVRQEAGSALASWGAELQNAGSSSSSSTVDQALSDGLADVRQVRDLLNLAMNAVVGNVNLSQSAVTAYQAQIGIGRAEVSAALTNLNALSQSIASEKAALNEARQELLLVKSGATAEQIAAQAAQVQAAQAAVQGIEAQLADSVIRAPFAGTVASVDFKIGQIASPNAPGISLVSSSAFEVEAYVAESDIGKVKTGDTAQVTLDAYGTGVSFPATVASIDSVETTADGTGAYKTVLQFAGDDPRIKSGLTARAMIKTAEHDGVVFVPRSAVIRRGDSYFALAQENGADPAERPVSLGIEDASGNVEITQGLQAGDKVVNFGN
ncbi:MAG: efflux RND transporter periplasmic adaptor subunit [Patescibacteria group bacterium]|nr:efflux RND transporter periplasmic adaptor subunit [Patescibacteria group bacterium]